MITEFTDHGLSITTCIEEFKSKRKANKAIFAAVHPETIFELADVFHTLHETPEYVDVVLVDEIHFIFTDGVNYRRKGYASLQLFLNNLTANVQIALLSATITPKQLKWLRNDFLTKNTALKNCTVVRGNFGVDKFPQVKILLQTEGKNNHALYNIINRHHRRYDDASQQHVGSNIVIFHTGTYETAYNLLLAIESNTCADEDDFAITAFATTSPWKVNQFNDDDGKKNIMIATKTFSNGVVVNANVVVLTDMLKGPIHDVVQKAGRPTRQTGTTSLYLLVKPTLQPIIDAVKGKCGPWSIDGLQDTANLLLSTLAGYCFYQNVQDIFGYEVNTSRYCNKCPVCHAVANNSTYVRCVEPTNTDKKQIFDQINKVLLAPENDFANCNDVVKKWPDTTIGHNLKLFALQLICEGYLRVVAHPRGNICYFKPTTKWQRETFTNDTTVRIKFKLDQLEPANTGTLLFENHNQPCSDATPA